MLIKLFFFVIYSAKYLTAFLKWSSLIVGLIGTPVSIFLMMNGQSEAKKVEKMNVAVEKTNTINKSSSENNNSKVNKVQKEHNQKVIMKALGKEPTNEEIENNESQSINDYYHTSLS